MVLGLRSNLGFGVLVNELPDAALVAGGIVSGDLQEGVWLFSLLVLCVFGLYTVRPHNRAPTN